MNVPELFELFDENIQEEPIGNFSNIEIKNNQLKIQIFMKMISNRKNLAKSLNSFGEYIPEFSLSTEELADTWMYNRALAYLRELDIEVLDILIGNVSIDWNIFLNCLQLAINYFESIEEYENCAFLFMIEKRTRKLQENLD